MQGIEGKPFVLTRHATATEWARFKETVAKLADEITGGFDTIVELEQTPYDGNESLGTRLKALLLAYIDPADYGTPTHRLECWTVVQEVARDEFWVSTDCILLERLVVESLQADDGRYVVIDLTDPDEPGDDFPEDWCREVRDRAQLLMFGAVAFPYLLHSTG